MKKLIITSYSVNFTIYVFFFFLCLSFFFLSLSLILPTYVFLLESKGGFGHSLEVVKFPYIVILLKDNLQNIHKIGASM